MRVFEVILRSGARVEVTAEIFDEDSGGGDKIQFYRDKGLRKIVAYFNKEDVAGILFGLDYTSQLPSNK
jgi:hypothetical protein